MVTVVSVLSVVLAIALLVFSCQGAAAWFLFIDFPSLILLGIIVIPVVCVSGFGKDFCRAFTITGRKKETTLLQLNKSIEAVKLVMTTLLYASIFVMLFSLMIVFDSFNETGIQAENLLNNINVALLPLVYALAFALLLLPVLAALKRKRIEYIQNE